MTGYIIRRLGQAVIVVLGVTIIAFFMEHLLPGGIARAILGPGLPSSRSSSSTSKMASTARCGTSTGFS